VAPGGVACADALTIAALGGNLPPPDAYPAGSLTLCGP
jgi:hypothetical protein